jgi:hypothetical protein
MKTHLAVLFVFSCVMMMFLTGSKPVSPSVPAFQSEDNVSFKWAFGAMVGTEKKFVSITHDTVLKSGDDLKMYIELVKDCFVYLVYQDSKGNISLIFPNDGFKQFTADYRIAKPYYIPKGRDWFQLDPNVGRESYYLLGSSERLLDLESLIGNYLSADASKKPDLAKNLIAEIRNIRKRFKTFATLAEKPITIGGNVRGIEKAESVRRPDVATLSTQVSANNLFSKTITIDHQ